MAQNTPSTPVTLLPDGRTQVRHGELAYELPTYPTLAAREALAAWEARAAHLRRRILTAAGLWPTPERCSLQPRVTGRVEHDAYTIENVFFESWPGFYVCGNLYRPKGKEGPFPGVLCPHGHWAHGRLEDGERGSIPARCITFARQGYVALAYDMIGYNDSGMQVAGRAAELGDGGPDDGSHKRYFHSPREFLWSISPLGLQLWNSVRALDYLASLPDVDGARLACTGASGGGTQTFLLCAIDERVRVAAPVNMVSAHFQGGCVCENAPNLRFDCTNVEFVALMAPRPLLMVSATGDWTANTPEVEYPAVRAIYRLYGAQERVAAVQVDAPHNYNRQSREAVYAWFGRWLLGESSADALKEQPYQLDPPEQMRVFRNPTCHSEERSDEESLAAIPGTDVGGDSSLPPVAQNDSVWAVAQKDSAREVTQKDSAREVAQKDSAREVAQKDSVWAVAQKDSAREGAQNDSVWAVAQKDSVRAVAQKDSVWAVAQKDSAREVAPALPEEAMTPEQLTEYWIGRAKAQIEGLKPIDFFGFDAATLHAYRETMGTAYRYALNARLPQASELRVERVGVEERVGVDGLPPCRAERLVIGRHEAGERTPGLLLAPKEPVGVVLVVHPEGIEGAISIAQGPLIDHLLARRLAVLTLDAWGAGALAGLQRDETVDHFLCFNRSDAALRVQDVLNGIGVLSAGAVWNAAVPGAEGRLLPVHLVGLGIAGMWCLLARALCGAYVARTVVDAAQFACDDDRAWLDALYLPHIRRAGDLRTAVALTAPGALYVHNAAPNFPSEFARQAYLAVGAHDALHIQAEPAGAETIVRWLAGSFQVSG